MANRKSVLVTLCIVLIALYFATQSYAAVCATNTINITVNNVPSHLSNADVPLSFNGTNVYTGNGNLRFHHPTTPGNNALILALSQTVAAGSTLTLSYEVDNAAGDNPQNAVTNLIAAGYGPSYWDRDNNGIFNAADFDVNGNGSITLGSGDYSTMGFVVKLYSGNPGNPVGSGAGTLVYTGYTPVKLMAAVTYTHTLSIPAAFNYITIESTPDGVGSDPRLNEIQLNGAVNTGPVAFNQTTCMELTKTANTSGLASPPLVGNVINYSLQVAATTGVPLSAITVSDPLGTVICPSSGNNTIASIAGNSSVTCSLAYPLTQVDLDGNGGGDGDIDNTATASTSTSSGPLSESKSLAVPITILPRLSISKLANTGGPVNAGNVITYTFTVANTGNVTISNVQVTDIHNGNGVPPVPASETLFIDGGTAGDSTDTISNDANWSVLRPSDTIRFQGSYAVIQADIDNLQ